MYEIKYLHSRKRWSCLFVTYISLPFTDNGSGLHFQVEQINAEYKVRALQFHPDKNEGDSEAQRKFQKLNVSVENLFQENNRNL
jgi:hypothetical protein